MLLTLGTRTGVMPREVSWPSAWRLRRWRAAPAARPTGAVSHVVQEESCVRHRLRRQSSTSVGADGWAPESPTQCRRFDLCLALVRYDPFRDDYLARGTE